MKWLLLAGLALATLFVTDADACDLFGPQAQMRRQSRRVVYQRVLTAPARAVARPFRSSSCQCNPCECSQSSRQSYGAPSYASAQVYSTPSYASTPTYSTLPVHRVVRAEKSSQPVFSNEYLYAPSSRPNPVGYEELTSIQPAYNTNPVKITPAMHYREVRPAPVQTVRQSTPRYRCTSSGCYLIE